MSFLAFEALCDKLNRPKDLLVIALDPGETTGVCVFNCSKVEVANHLGTGDMNYAPKVIAEFLDPYWEYDPYIVCEDYRIYGWKADSHKWASLHTSRLIGCVETICSMKGAQVYKNMAQGPKTFCTDERLRDWDFYTTKRHARDAIRHACYFVLFSKAVDHVRSGRPKQAGTEIQ